ncbi:hypothetical protein [Halocatena halophila]|uniref:hypothetical protein n=1 Tax=Halocatena halophila TaxID=2814576 RepID=UPI002ED42E48
MTAYLIKKDEEVVGYLTDRALADYLDGKEIVTDGMHERQEFQIEEVPNDDVL